MGLVQAGFLMALAALAIPVAVHLLSRWQVRRIEFGTMRFLQEVLHDSSHRRRIRRWLLLSVRMLLVGLLAALFARPFFAEISGGEGDQERIVLLDRSASMTMQGQSGRLLDDAIAAASEYVERSNGEGNVRWAWFDAHVEPLPEGTTRPSPPRVLSGDTNYFAALSWARDRIAARPLSKAEVILVTDLQAIGLASADTAAKDLAFPRDVPVRIIDIGRPAANNCAILSVTTDAPQLPPSRPVVVKTSLFNYGAMAVEEVPITALALSGARSVRQKKTLNIAKEQAAEVAFDFGTLESGKWQITVDIDLEDDLASDNRRVTAVDVAAPKSVLVIDPGSQDAGFRSASYYLVAALKQGINLNRASEDASTSQDEEEPDQPKTENIHRVFDVHAAYIEDDLLPTLSPNEISLIVVADAGLTPLSLVQQLEAYVLGGGRLLVFSGTNLSDSIASQWGDSRLFPGTLVRTEMAATMPFRLVSLAPNANMLDPFRDPQNGDLSRLAFSSLVKAEVPDEKHVIASFDDGQPALTKHDLGKGKIAWFLSSADNKSSNWTTSPLYLPLVRQIASDLLGLAGEGPVRFRHVGDLLHSSSTSDSSPSQLLKTEHNAKKDTSSSATSDQSLRAQTLFNEPGFQTHDEALYAINTHAKESDTARIDAATFFKHFELTPAQGENSPTARLVEKDKRRELWPWLAAALVVLLIFEFALSNRTPS